MKIKTFFAYTGLFIGVFLFSMMGYVSGVEKSKAEKVPPIIAREGYSFPDAIPSGNSYAAEELAEIFKESYILRENENKISLFIRYSNGDEQIHSEYDIAVNLLPENDRQRLKEGIEFDSADDVITFIEDYMG